MCGKLVPIAGLLLCVAIGCEGGKPSCSVQGTIKFGSVPVSEGTITFEETSTMNSVQSKLNSDGKYSLRVVAGYYKIMVEPPMIAEQGTSDVGVTYKDVKNIPNKYRSSASTTLSARIDSDKTLDFDLKN